MNSLPDLDQIKKIVQEECQLQQDQKVIVGVSGGPDSLALTDILTLLGYPVVVAHFDHQLRPDSADDASFVAEFARARGLPFRSAVGDVAGFAQADGLSIEEAARSLRYRFLFETARAEGAQAVAVGHTANDQVETVLMHFLRGAGLSGLKGMSTCSPAPEWDASIPLVRPLLSTWREEIEAHCASRGLQPRRDPTNQELTYFRNRLRNELIPQLETYNPRVKEVIWRTARLLSADYAFLAGEVEKAWGQAERAPGGDIRLSLDELRAMPGAILRGVLRRAISRLRPGLRNIDFISIDRAVRFIDTPTATGKMDWISNLMLVVEADQLVVVDPDRPPEHPDWLQLAGENTIMLPIPGVVLIGEKWEIQVELFDRPPEDFRAGSQDRYTAWMDRKAAGNRLIVRTRRSGDRFQPIGMDGHSLKLSDYFINQGLPRLARQRWPLVCVQENDAVEDRIAWVPGFRPAEFTKITPATQQVIRLSVRPTGAVSS